MPHIAIDARMYGTAQRGIGRYLIKLIEQLEQVVPSPPTPLPAGEGGRSPGEGHTFTIFLRRANWDEYTPRNPNFKKALWDIPWYGWREQFARYTLHATRYTLVHFPHWNVPLLFHRPFVVTIHDLELFSSNRTRENSTRGRVAYRLKHLAFRIVFRHAVLSARAIIVPSKFVCEQLLDLYPQVRKKIKVIYEAPTIDRMQNEELRMKNADLKLDTKNLKLENNSTFYILNSKFVLYVGAAYPHKNLDRLLEAWQIVHKELPDYKLVLVGREDFFWKRLKQEWNTPTPPNLPSGRGGKIVSPPLGGGVRGGLVFYGSASDEELATLYSNATLLVQPSLEEGFSLSPLEALSFGCPVAVSDIAVHREILGNAARYFDPHATPSMASALISALTAPNLKTTAQQAGSALLNRYSWHTHAQETLDLYAAAEKV